MPSSPFKVGDRVVVLEGHAIPELVGRVGTITDERSVSGWPGIDFGVFIADVTHDLGGHLTSATGRFVEKADLKPAKEHYLKLFKKLHEKKTNQDRS